MIKRGINFSVVDVPVFIDISGQIVDLFYGMPDDLTPTRGSLGAAGFDLRAACDGQIAPNQISRVPTGVRVNLPSNHVGLVCSRSGLAYKHGIFIINSPGVIDEDYEGEIVMILGKLDDSTNNQEFKFSRGDRLAQLLIVPIYDQFFGKPFGTTRHDSNNMRGQNGFGSTGIS